MKSKIKFLDCRKTNLKLFVISVIERILTVENVWEEAISKIDSMKI